MNCCPRCNREVFFAERKVALGRVWHSFCFSCYKCRKLLDACSVHTYCNELYCNACYNSLGCSGYKSPCCTNKPPPCKACCDPCGIVRCEPCPECTCCKPTKKTRSSYCKVKSCGTGNLDCNPCCPVRCCKNCDDPCDACCCLQSSPRKPSTPCRRPSLCKPCDSCIRTSPCSPCRDICDPCACPLPCKPCDDPFCGCCGKEPTKIVCMPTQHYSLRPTSTPKPCEPNYPCLVAEVAGTANTQQMCDAVPSRIPPCCAQKPGSACAAPTPRETKNYYSRNHKKPIDSSCKGSCYCPGECTCPHKGFEGRFAGSNSCDPCAVMDCCPDECSCCSPRMNCCPKKRPCLKPKCCPDLCDPCGKCKPTRECSPCRPCNPCGAEPCCKPCCPPYCPPCRKPICYPPVKCCENDCESPLERICYYPCPTPPQPKYCTCGSPNPCDCDLNAKRRQAICEMSPCCRRCGRKVYAAEQIMASGGAFHSSCFSCYSCHKPLEVTNVYENQGEIYCKQCYAKYFGMQGYGYGSTLLSPL